MPSCRKAVSDYGKRSSIQGFSHWNNTKSRSARVFWVLVTASSMCLCCYHIYHSITNFLNTPVSSSYFYDKAAAVFPDVTFCNIKPIGETVLQTQREELEQQLSENWGFFDTGRWLNRSERYQSENEFLNHILLQQLFQLWLEAFWISDSTKAYGMAKEDMVMVCAYNGQPCNEEDFFLIQSHRYWNCYTFSPQDKTVYSTEEDSGLDLILFTDSNLNGSHPKEEFYLDKLHVANNTPVLFKTFIENEMSFNDIISGFDIEGRGVKVFIHNHYDFPFSSGQDFIIPNGERAQLKFTQLYYKTIAHSEYNCFDGEAASADYVVALHEDAAKFSTRRFSLSRNEVVGELKQAYLFRKCGCYSHRLIFNSTAEDLCFYVKPGRRRNPEQKLFERMDCFIREMPNMLMVPFDHSEAIRQRTPCRRQTYGVSSSRYRWPAREDIKNFIKLYVQPISPLHLKGADEKRRARYTTIFNAMLNNSCQDFFERNNGSSSTSDQRWCLPSEKVFDNFVRIAVRPKEIVASVYEEHKSYQWPEVLSEIGGTLGLWLGFSLLTFAELVEFASSSICGCTTKNRHRKEQDSTHENVGLNTLSSEPEFV